MESSAFRRRIARYTHGTLRWGRDRLPPGVRSLVGVLFMICGVFGFLPILGFWMFPLGIAFIALDIPFARRRLDRWMVKLGSEAGNPTAQQPQIDRGNESRRQG